MMDSFTKKEQIVILIIVLLITSILGYKFIIKDLIKPKEMSFGLVSDVSVDENEIVKEDLLVEEKTIIMVHVSGQVNNPGIVKLFLGDRLVDAIDLVGGLKKEADIDRINLAMKLSDEQKIYVPSIGEELKEPISNISYQESTSQNSSSGLNINNCSGRDLESLPGIGPVLAERIIEYRNSKPFKNIDELKNVSGIGDKKFEALKELITVK